MANGWYSAQELAGLPGIAGTERGVRKSLQKNLHLTRSKERGKGVEYPINCLPAETQAALRDRELGVATKALPAIPQQVTAPIALSAPAYLVTDKQRVERDARNGVLYALAQLQQQSHCSREAALTTLLTSARAGKLDDYTDKILRQARDSRGRAGDGYPSIRTLKRWLSAGDLTPKIQQKDMRVPAWAKDFLSLYQVPQKPSVEEAYRDFSHLWPGVSVHQVRRFLAKLGEVTRERGRMGARELKNIRPFIRRDWSDFQPNDAWIADGHTFDAEVQHPLHGRPFRPEITVFIDGGTRRITGWSISLAENAISVADALATGVRLCGLPAIVYGDNGAGYRANLLTDEATGILSRIHATPEFALPYNSQAKGIIERLHRTVWVAAAKELPSYVGMCMDKEARLAQFKLTRKALKHGGTMPMIPYEVFVNFVGEKVAIYNARPHRSLGGISPDGAWAAWIARGWQAERLTEAELVDFFRPRIERTVARGEINLFTNIYYSRQLEEFHGMALHVAYDIRDPARVWIYAPDGRFICDAEVNGNKRSAFPVAVQQQAREKRARGRLQRVDVKRNEILEELHGGPALVAPTSEQIVIGGRIIDHDALEHTLQKVKLSDENAQLLDENLQQIGQEPQQNALSVEQRAVIRQSRSERPAAENYAEWIELDRRLRAGDSVSEADARWHRTYPNSAQFRAEEKRKAAA